MGLGNGHLLTIADLTAQEIKALIERAVELKVGWAKGYRPRPLTDKVVALIFEKPSTRTRVSFEVATVQLGGTSLFISSRDTQLARGEPLKDVARVMSGYVDCLVVRTFGQEVVEELAKWGSIPVVNALTDRYHPCQVLSDLFTVREHFGTLERLVFAWVGDGNNMAHSWIEAAGVLGLELRLACPEGYRPEKEIVERAMARGGKISITADPSEAVRGAHVISTDVWASMGQEHQQPQRQEAFKGYSVDENLLSLAPSNAIVMHCLPAHRGEEISEGVLEGPRSVVWQQAANRLHMQKAILEALVGSARREE